MVRVEPDVGATPIGALPFSILGERYQDGAVRADLHSTFATAGYVAMPGLFDPGVLMLLQSEARRLEPLAVARSFIMPRLMTPRRLSTIGGEAILRKSAILPSLYSHFEVRSLVEDLVGGPIYPCTHRQEWMVVNYLEGRGATHGFHLDDPEYALVIFLEAPEPSKGGELEFIRNWREFCCERGRDPEMDLEAGVETYRMVEPVQVRHHNVGGAYLLYASQLLHRVADLKADDCRRVVLNLAYQQRRDANYGDTADLLYS